MSIRDEIVDHIKSGLENNTLGETFNIGADIKQAQERYQFLTQENYYTEDILEYIPAIINLEETPVGNPEIDKSQWSISVEFSLTGQDDDDTNLINERAAIEEFRKELRTNPVTFFVVGSDTYDVFFKPTHAVRTGQITDQAGNNRITYIMGIAVLSGIGLSFGSKFEIEKDGEFVKTELFTDVKDYGTAVEYNTSENDTDDFALGVPNKGLWQATIKMVYNDGLLAHRYLYDLGVAVQPFDELIVLTITKPNTGEITKNVNAQVKVLENSGLDIPLQVTFTEAEV